MLASILRPKVLCRRIPQALVIAWAMVFTGLSSTAAEPIAFRVHSINLQSEFSAATAFDMNQDGHLDVISGAWWYEGPSWKKHKFREVEQIRGRYDDYSNLALDVDQDGDQDIVSVNYRSKSLYWCRNPGSATNSAPEGTLWESIVIDRPGPSETGRLADIDGDGQLDVLPNGTQFAAWYANEISDEGQVQWRRYDLPSQLAGHGLGCGDINGDGRTDVICPTGWAEAPLDPRRERWRFHADFNLAGDCGLPILCTDVDGDGDSDLIWGRGHNIGLYWTEQINAPEPAFRQDSGRMPESLEALLPHSKWVTHAIDTRFACLHTLMLADIDGDECDDLVVGKRFMGHDGRDPGENDPLCTNWYRFEPETRTWSSHQMTFGGKCGVDLDSVCVDLDQDGDVDVLAPSRSGLHWIENLRINADGQESKTISSSAPSYDNHDDLSYYLTADGERRALKTALDHGRRRQHILEQMQLVMGELPNSVRRIPLMPRLLEIAEEQTYWRLRIDYAAERADSGDAQRVPAYLLIPKAASGPCPAMLCLHPTNFQLGKAQICGLGGKPSRFYADELAKRGFVCLAPDYPSFGEYADYDFTDDLHASGSMKAIWDNIRGIDLLESLPCVDRDRIGGIGHSLGGHNALFTAAFDQRVRCIVSSCGFTRFQDYYEGDLSGWTSERYMPRIATRYDSLPGQMPFDFPEVLAAIAPRPLFINAPLHDHNFAVNGVKSCESLVAPLYQMLDASEDFKFEFPDAAHDFPSAVRDASYRWLQDRLQP